MDSLHYNALKASAPRRRRGRGFTLVELLVVILIIMVMLATLLPTLARIRTQALINKSQSVVNLIHGAVLQYRAELNAYPVDCHNLVPALTGFRLVDRGRFYGPYGGVEELGYPAVDQGETQLFVDAFGRSVLYYTFERDLQTEEWKVKVVLDIDGPGEQENESGVERQIPLEEYLTGPEERYFRTDFVLISRGPDGLWGGKCRHPAAPDDPKRYKMYPAYTENRWVREFDDVTNFLNQ